jgi:hypothetical protein
VNRLSLPFWLYGLLIFSGGAAVGALGHRLYSASAVRATAVAPRPDEWRQRFTEEMKTRVKLDKAQLERLNVILDESKELFDQVRSKYHPEMKAIYDAQVQRINDMLNERQRAEYAKIREEQRMAREKRKAEGGR